MAVSTIADDKKKALNLAIAQIEKSCGKGSIMRMDEKEKVRVEAVPTGAINLDAAIGVGGILAAESRRSTDRSRAERRRSVSTSSRTRRRWAVSPRSSTRSTRSTRSTHASWASTSSRC
jgi:hypothetical protein